jgi:beta-galactosidase
VLTEKRETSGPAAKLEAVPDRMTMTADGQDCVVINVRVLDAQGRPVPTAPNMVEFQVSGPGAVAGVGNGDPSCHEPDHATRRSAFNGLCMAIVQGRRGETGGVTVSVTSAGLTGATVRVSSEPAVRLVPLA